MATRFLRLLQTNKGLYYSRSDLSIFPIPLGLHKHCAYPGVRLVAINSSELF